MSINRNIVGFGLCVLLYGCAADNDRTADKKFSTDQVLVDEHGLTLNPSKDMYISFQMISKVYVDTMACMGMTAEGPVVEYRSFSFAGLGGAWAFYHPVASTIWVNTDENETLLERDSRTDIEALRHEFVHHILHMNGGGKESRGHASPLLKKCGLGVKTDN